MSYTPCFMNVSALYTVMHYRASFRRNGHPPQPHLPPLAATWRSPRPALPLRRHERTQLLDSSVSAALWEQIYRGGPHMAGLPQDLRPLPLPQVSHARIVWIQHAPTLKFPQTPTHPCSVPLTVRCSRGLRLLTRNIRKLDETCGLTGPLPHQIGYLENLQELYARRVGMYGPIPKVGVGVGAKNDCI